MEPQITVTGVALTDPDRTSDPDRVAAAGGDFEAMVRVYRLKIFRFVLASLRDGDAADSVTRTVSLRPSAPGLHSVASAAWIPG